MNTQERTANLSMPDLNLARFDKTTFALFSVTSLSMTCIIAYAFLGNPSLWTSLALGLFVALPCLFFNFSVIHEAAHRNISKNRKVNDFMGRVGAFWLLGSFKHFRWVHLEHHAHVNKEGLDPDLHAGENKNFFTWCFILLHYLNHIRKNKVRSKFRKTDFLHYIFTISLVSYGVWMGQALPLLLMWILPALLSIGFMVLCFDYLPHRPHKETTKHKASTIRLLPKWMETLFMGQNLHLVHHLWPSIPWHQYRAAYDAKAEDLKLVGARVIKGFEDRRATNENEQRSNSQAS